MGKDWQWNSFKSAKVLMSESRAPGTVDPVAGPRNILAESASVAVF